jgi:hypothetical protein
MVCLYFIEKCDKIEAHQKTISYEYLVYKFVSQCAYILHFLQQIKVHRRGNF